MLTSRVTLSSRGVTQTGVVAVVKVDFAVVKVDIQSAD